jgi:hypothetical protein
LKVKRIKRSSLTQIKSLPGSAFIPQSIDSKLSRPFQEARNMATVPLKCWTSHQFKLLLLLSDSGSASSFCSFDSQQWWEFGSSFGGPEPKETTVPHMKGLPSGSWVSTAFHSLGRFMTALPWKPETGNCECCDPNPCSARWVAVIKPLPFTFQRAGANPEGTNLSVLPLQSVIIEGYLARRP